MADEVDITQERIRPGDPIGQMVFFRHTPVPHERSYAARGRYNGDKTVETIKEHNMHRTSKLKDNFYTICAVLAGFILFGFVGAMDAEDEQAQLEHYCEMVKLHKQDPSTGWPDYDGIYDTACLK